MGARSFDRGTENERCKTWKGWRPRKNHSNFIRQRRRKNGCLIPSREWRLRCLSTDNNKGYHGCISEPTLRENLISLFILKMNWWTVVLVSNLGNPTRLIDTR